MCVLITLILTTIILNTLILTIVKLTTLIFTIYLYETCNIIWKSLKQRFTDLKEN